jgi:hypothetical protein
MLTEKRDFGGRWKISHSNDREKMTKHQVNVAGVVKTNIIYYKEVTNRQVINIISILYDGENRDQVVYQKLSLSQDSMNYKRVDSVTTLTQNDTRVEIHYGRLYSYVHDHDCFVNVTAEFTEHGSKKVNLEVTLTSDGKCFPEEMVIKLKSPDENSISKRRVLNYVLLLITLLIFYCLAINKQ